MTARQLTTPQAGLQLQERVPQEDGLRNCGRVWGHGGGESTQRKADAQATDDTESRGVASVARRDWQTRTTHLGEITTERRGTGSVCACEVCAHRCAVHLRVHTRLYLCACMCVRACTCVRTCECAGWGQAVSGGSRRAGVPRGGKPTAPREQARVRGLWRGRRPTLLSPCVTDRKNR